MEKTFLGSVREIEKLNVIKMKTKKRKKNKM